MAVAVVHDVALQDLGSGSSGLGKALKHTALSKAQQNQHLPATETQSGERGILTAVLL